MMRRRTTACASERVLALVLGEHASGLGVMRSVVLGDANVRAGLQQLIDWRRIAGRIRMAPATSGADVRTLRRGPGGIEMNIAVLRRASLGLIGLSLVVSCTAGGPA